jgi:hypothetical protein
LFKEGEMQSTIVMEGPHSSSYSDSWFIVSTSSPASQRQTYTTLTVESTHEQTESNIFDKYKQIKQRNELLNNNTYAQFWKQTSTAQHRLLSSFDIERGRMQMAFLQAQVPHPKTVADYKKTSFEFDVKDVHPVDQMDMHRKTGEMIFSTLIKHLNDCFKVVGIPEQYSVPIEDGENLFFGQGQQNQIIRRIGVEDWV